MKRKLTFILILTALNFFMTACNDKNELDKTSLSEENLTKINETENNKNVELYIHAAASMTDALNAVKEKYSEERPNVTLTINYASSGTLQRQIEEGAPADVFISAAQKQMDELESQSLINTSSRIDLLENKVVLIVPKSSDIEINSFEECAESIISLIAIGNPDSVPVGQYAQELFTNLGIWDEIKDKSNFAADVREVLSWVETGNVDCGVVYATDAAISNNVKIVCEAPEGSHKAVKYPAAVIEDSNNTDKAMKFLKYLQGEEAAEIFENFGFSTE